MILNLKRYSDNGESTMGLLYIDGLFYCYTIEDAFRVEKVAGETRIPDGTYEIKYREVESEKTKQYRDKHKWFTWHLELQNVPNFKYVYIHIGNKALDSEGCILVGDMPTNNRVSDGFVGQSTSRFRDLYERIARAFDNRERVEIIVESIENV